MIDTSKYRVGQGDEISLEEKPTDSNSVSMDEAARQFEDDIGRLPGLHERLSAEEKGSILIVLLGFDTSGKDPTINSVFNQLPVQGLQIEKFNEPGEEAEKHDFLWRYHIEAPKRGEIIVFNRSYYDGVVEPRMSGDLDDEMCKIRFKHLLNFEELLSEEQRTRILKFYLHISRDEQARRIWDRLEDPERQWDFDPHDIDTHERWDEYQGLYEEILNTTSTERSPWYVVPADNEDLRNAIVARVVTETLDDIDPRFPEPSEDIERWKERMRELD